MGALKRILTAAGVVALLAGPAFAAGDAPKPPKVHWSFAGMFGTFDRAELQRGFQVYKEVCAACHSLKYLSYRDLAALGFNEEEVKAIAAGFEVQDLNDEGEPAKRPARPSDRFVSPFPNDKAARAANNGALPPDLTLLTKAREGFQDYMHGLLIGYENPPAGFQMQPGMNYNKYFPGHQIAMPPPLSEGQVTYADNTKATVEQMARDVVAFLSWAAEPELEARKAMGVKVILFLIVLSGLLYAVKRKVWSDVH
jgi:ubiquinol-cytochrome c reductase cytochrome c1 subunit